MTKSYPLQWPQGWPRTPENRRENTNKFRTSRADAAHRLLHELKLLKAQNVVLSSNIPIRNDGLPYADVARRVITDPGVAVYFTLRGGPMTMARDLYDTVYDNIRSLGIAIEHLRGLERHGGAHMMDRAFNGFTALPPPANAPREETVDWRQVFAPIPEGLAKAEILAVIEARWRMKAKNAHPDKNAGSDSAMIRLNMAIAQARGELRG